MVRVLGRLPAGAVGRGRKEGLHPRQAEEGQEEPRQARERGDPLHLPRPGPLRGGAAALDDQPHRGRRQRAVEGDGQGASRAVGHPEGQGRLLVVLHAHRMPAARGEDPRGDADR